MCRPKYVLGRTRPYAWPFVVSFGGDVYSAEPADLGVCIGQINIEVSVSRYSVWEISSW